MKLTSVLTALTSLVFVTASTLPSVSPRALSKRGSPKGISPIPAWEVQEPSLPVSSERSPPKESPPVPALEIQGPRVPVPSQRSPPGRPPQVPKAPNVPLDVPVPSVTLWKLKNGELVTPPKILWEDEPSNHQLPKETRKEWMRLACEGARQARCSYAKIRGGPRQDDMGYPGMGHAIVIKGDSDRYHDIRVWANGNMGYRRTPVGNYQLRHLGTSLPRHMWGTPVAEETQSTSRTTEEHRGPKD